MDKQDSIKKNVGLSLTQDDNGSVKQKKMANRNEDLNPI